MPQISVRDKSLSQAKRGLGLAFFLPAALLVLLLGIPALNVALRFHLFHMLLVLPVAAFTAGVTVWMGYVGLRQRNADVVLLSLAFASLGLVYGVHGLVTPEVGMMAHHHDSAASLPAGALLGALLCTFWLLLASLPATNGAVRALLALRGWLLGLWLLALLLLGSLVMRPEVAHLVYPDSPSGRWALLGLGLALCVWAGVRHWLSWRYARAPLLLGVVYACAWLALGEVLILLNYAWTLSWWVYHVLLVLVTVSLLVGLEMQYRQPDVPLGTALRGLWNNQPEDLLQAGISRPVRALAAEVERHDPYTAGHAYRVTLYALKLARALDCSPEALRVITQGGVLHDLGKLDVPAEILNYPGKLDQDEWALVQQHPLRGYQRGQHLGLLPDELDLILYHHERWDGTGYPQGLQGEQIPYLARILAVADVFDALTSERAYREAWSTERANNLIAQEAGQSFDPQIVAAWLGLHQATKAKTLPRWAMPTEGGVRQPTLHG